MGENSKLVQRKVERLLTKLILNAYLLCSRKNNIQPIIYQIINYLLKVSN